MSINKVVIAAAGQGTRMKDLTKDKSKHLIEVNQRPFLAYLLDNLLEAGYSDITLVAGFGSELVEKFLKDNNYKANVLNQFEILGPKEKIYGTACPLMCVKNISDQFLYICGDNFYSVKDLKNVRKGDQYSYVSGMVSKTPERFGVLKTNGEFLQQIIEKPQEFVGNLINTSLYKFTPEILKKVFEIQKSPRGEYEITDAVNLLAKEGKVKVNQLQDSDYWIDFGRPEDIEKFAQILKHEGNKS